MKIYFLFIAFLFLMGSCRLFEQTNQDGVESVPYDPNQPVTVTKILPDSGGIAQRFVLSGNNLGTDVQNLRVMFRSNYSNTTSSAAIISSNGKQLYGLVPKLTNPDKIDIYDDMKVWIERLDGKGQVLKVDTLSVPFRYLTTFAVTTVCGVPKLGVVPANESVVVGTLSDTRLKSPASITADNYGNVFMTCFNAGTAQGGKADDATILRINEAENKTEKAIADVSYSECVVTYDGGETLYFMDNDGAVLRRSLRSLGYVKESFDFRWQLGVGESAPSTPYYIKTIVYNPQDKMGYFVTFNTKNLGAVDFDNRYTYNWGKIGDLGGDDIYLGIDTVLNVTYAIHFNTHCILTIHPLERDEEGGTIALQGKKYKPFHFSKGNPKKPDTIAYRIIAGTSPTAVEVGGFHKGLASGTAGYMDGDGTDSKFNFPRQCVIRYENPGQPGDLYVADCANHCIRRLTPQYAANGDINYRVSTVVGTPGASGYKDGIRDNALFWYPSYMTIAPDGTIYINDGVRNAGAQGASNVGNQVLRKLSMQ